MHKDVTEPFFVEEPVDFVYHFASPASPIDYLRLPLHTLKVGSYGTHHALGLAKLHRARFLTASTSEVYGDPQVHPQPESYWGHVNPIGPRGVYDEAKRYAEALTMAYHRQQGVDTAIVRIFNTYGPRMRPHDGRAIPTFLRQALQDRPITVFGDGSQTRSFCLRQRPDRGDHPARRVRRAPAGEHRQPERVHAAGAGQDRRSRSPARARRSCSRRCRPTIPRSASRTSRSPASCSAGSRRSSCATACGARLTPPASPRSPARTRERETARQPRTAPVDALRASGRRPTRIPEPPPTRSHAPARETVVLPPVDVRRKRPPALSFLLRMETLRRASRVISLLALDFAGLLAALIVALMVKAVLRDGDWAWDASLHEARDTIAFVYLVTVLLFARSGLYAERAQRPGLARIVSSLFQVDGRLADLRAGQRHARLLELLHLLRDAVLRGDHPGIGAVGLRDAHRRDPARRGLPPAGRAGRHRPATSRRSRTR